MASFHSLRHRCRAAPAALLRRRGNLADWIVGGVRSNIYMIGLWILCCHNHTHADGFGYDPSIAPNEERQSTRSQYDEKPRDLPPINPPTNGSPVIHLHAIPVVFATSKPSSSYNLELLPAEVLMQREAVQRPTISVAPEPQQPLAPKNEIYVSSPAWDFTPTTNSQPDVNPPDRIELDPWWNEEIKRPMLGEQNVSVSAELETLIWQAIANSPQVQSLLTTPQIRETQAAQASSIFDPTRFAESIFNDTSDPVGNLLTTGGAPRLKENYLNNNMGVRGLNRFGGKTELSQNMSMRDNNSQFFVPNQQADAKIVLQYTHPLRRGSGLTYNGASIALARVSANVSQSDAKLGLQNHVFDVIQNYWKVFYNRAAVLQGQRALLRLERIADNISERADLDGTQSQASRARAAVSSQRSRLQRSAAELTKSEAQLKMLVNAPELKSGPTVELIPITMPSNERVSSDTTFELAKALESRPEIIAIRDQIRGTQLQLHVAENELKSTLNLVTQSYMHGLNGNYGVADSFADQFSRGRPSYTAGIEYQRANNNSAAKAIMRQRRLEMRQLLFDLDQQLLTVSTEIYSAAAELTASFAEYQSAVETTTATSEELNYLVDRWNRNPFLDNSNPAQLLDELLDSESRLIQAENNWSLAQSSYMIAIGRAQLVAGSLLDVNQIGASEGLSDEEPELSDPR